MKPQPSGVLFSGMTSQAALDSWHSASTTVAVDQRAFSVQATMIEQPFVLGQDDVNPATLQDVLATRYGLPLVNTLDEAELNNASSPYSLRRARAGDDLHTAAVRGRL